MVIYRVGTVKNLRASLGWRNYNDQAFNLRLSASWDRIEEPLKLLEHHSSIVLRGALNYVPNYDERHQYLGPSGSFETRSLQRNAPRPPHTMLYSRTFRQLTH